MNCVRYLQNNVCLIFYSIFFSFLCLIPFVPSVTLMWLFSVYTHCSVCTFSLHPLFMSQQQYCQHIIISITSLAKPLIFSFNLYIFKTKLYYYNLLFLHLVRKKFSVQFCDCCTGTPAQLASFVLYDHLSSSLAINKSL